jgi:8-hydroxy-5-deazaflavin:NADPH oxidoreductase
MIGQIGFLGGTGIEGKGLALRFALAGARVIVGSRSAERAQSAAQEYNNEIGNALIRGMTNSEMLASSEIVFLTVPFDHAKPALEGLRADFPANLVLVDVTVPMQFKAGQVEYLEPSEGSNAELIASLVPESVQVVAAFKTIPAHILAETDVPLQCDVLVCSDSQDARRKVMAAAGLIPTLRPLDAGPLKTARTLERMTVLAIHLNRHYKKKGARYRIEGL